jgi:SMC interacting uncharacterized protein involved in chromosome segregation
VEPDIAGDLANDEDIKNLVRIKSEQLANQRIIETRRAQAGTEFLTKAATLQELLQQKKIDSKRLEAALKEALEAHRLSRA